MPYLLKELRVVVDICEVAPQRVALVDDNGLGVRQRLGQLVRNRVAFVLTAVTRKRRPLFNKTKRERRGEVAADEGNDEVDKSARKKRAKNKGKWRE